MTSPAECKRILFVNHSLPPWEYTGTPITTLNHALGMQQRGLHVAVLVPSASEVRVGFKKEIRDGLTLYRVPAFDRYKAFLGTLDKKGLKLYLAMIAYIAKDFTPDIVQMNDYVGMPREIIALFHDLGYPVVRNVCNDEEICHQDYPVIGNGLEGKLCSGPISADRCAVCYLANIAGMGHERVPRSGKKKLAAVMARRMAAIRELYRGKIDAAVFTSAPFKNHFTKFVPIASNKIRIIPRGFKLEQQSEYVRKNEAVGDEIRFAFFGTLMFSKGIDVLLRAFERVVDRKSFRLDLHGFHGNPQFQDWVKRLETEHPGRIFFHGDYQPEVFAQLAGQTDVAIVPSYFDTYNRVVRECLHYGVPVISSDFFGAFIIRNGANGLKFKIGDDKALAAAMMQVIDEPGLLDILRAGARATAIPSLDDEIEAMLDLYKAVLFESRLRQAKKTLVSKNDRQRSSPDQDSWSREGDLYLRDIDRLLRSVLENSTNLPISCQGTLFVDTGEGFNGRDLVRERITRCDDGRFQVTFDLRNFEIIVGVRFDPWEGSWGRLKLDEIVAASETGRQNNISITGARAMNGALGTDGSFTFKTSDPMVEIPGISGPCSTLTIRGRLEFMDVYEMEAEWAKEQEPWATEKPTILASLSNAQAEGEALRRQLARSNQELHNLELLLRVAIIIRGWHSSRPGPQPVALFGTGSLAEWVLQLLDHSRFQLCCCFDNRPRAALFQDLPVRQPVFIPDISVIIASIHEAEIRQQLKDLGYKDENLLSLQGEKPLE